MLIFQRSIRRWHPFHAKRKRKKKVLPINYRMQREGINILNRWVFFPLSKCMLWIFFSFAPAPIYWKLDYKILYSREHKVFQYHLAEPSRSKWQISSRCNAMYTLTIPWGLHFLVWQCFQTFSSTQSQIKASQNPKKSPHSSLAIS